MSDINQTNPDKLSRSQILIFMGVTALILMAIAQIWKNVGMIETIPLQFTKIAYIQGITLALLIIMASAIVAQVWPPYRVSAEKYLDFIITPLAFPDLIWVGLLPGLSEELLFRGVMIPGLGYDWFAVIVSSILFGVLHLNDRDSWHYVIWAIVIGFVLGYSAYATGNLIIPIIAHIIINLFSGIFWKVKMLKTNPH